MGSAFAKADLVTGETTALSGAEPHRSELSPSAEEDQVGEHI